MNATVATSSPSVAAQLQSHAFLNLQGMSLAHATGVDDLTGLYLTEIRIARQLVATADATRALIARALRADDAGDLKGAAAAGTGVGGGANVDARGPGRRRRCGDFVHHPQHLIVRLQGGIHGMHQQAADESIGALRSVRIDLEVATGKSVIRLAMA